MRDDADLALPPSASASFLASSAAAALLSVATVVSGMSLSTPESKAMTGMSLDCACWSSGMTALLSRAAMATASGCLSKAPWSWVTCCSTSVSLSGPSKVTVTPSSFAFASAPFFTVCQN